MKGPDVWLRAPAEAPWTCSGCSEDPFGPLRCPLTRAAACSCLSHDALLSGGTRDIKPVQLNKAAPSPQTLHPSIPPSLRPSDPPSLHPFVPPTLRPSVPPSLRPSVPLTLRPSVPLYLRPSIPPSLHPSDPPSLRPLLSSTLDLRSLIYSFSMLASQAGQCVPS